MLQRCQARLLSVDGQKQAPAADKSNTDIPKSGNSGSKNILIGVGAVALGAAVYYVSFLSLVHIVYGLNSVTIVW